MRKAQDLAGRIVAAAEAQRRELLAGGARAALVAEIASEIPRAREQIAELDCRLEYLLAMLPEVEVVRSLPGMVAVFTAGFLAEVGDLSRLSSADSLAAAGGLPRSSGTTSCQRRARQQGPQTHPVPLGLQLHLPPRAKRSLLPEEAGRRQGHHQAVITLAAGGWTFCVRCCGTGRPTARGLLGRLDQRIGMRRGSALEEDPGCCPARRAAWPALTYQAVHPPSTG